MSSTINELPTPIAYLNKTKLKRLLILCFILLALGHMGAMYVRHGLGYYIAKGLVPLFHFDSEFNIPTFYSVGLISLCALCLFRIGKSNTTPKKDRAAWILLSVLFVFLAADELFSVHEQIDQAIRGSFETSGAFHFAWVIPYGLVIALLATLLLPWFIRQPRSYQIMFVLAGTLFVGGALGMEMISGIYYSTLDSNRAEYATLTGDLLSSIEEIGEILGMSLFLYALALRLGMPE